MPRLLPAFVEDSLVARLDVVHSHGALGATLVDVASSASLSALRTKVVRHSSFIFPTSFSSEDRAGIDDPPNETDIPDLFPAAGAKSKKEKAMEYLSGTPAAPPEVFGVDPRALPDMVEATHTVAKQVDENAALAKDAAEEAIAETAGVGQAVDAADEAWRGVLYAAKVGGAMEKVLEGKNAEERFIFDDLKSQIKTVDGDVRDLASTVETQLNQIAQQKSSSSFSFSDPVDQAKKELGKPLTNLKDHQELIQFGEFDNLYMNLHKLLNEPTHPNLFPPQDSIGMKDGNLIIPLEFPPHPDPQVIEDVTPPDRKSVV